MRYRIVIALIFFSPVFSWAEGLEVSEYLLVKKSERKLYLMRNEKPFRQYKIALGKNPLGHKQHAGDNRTPEGRYVLDWRRISPKYHKSIHISYPDEQDIQSAKQRGVDPGNMIMIHGLPEGIDWKGLSIQNVDWTNGCIALTNEEIDEIWNLVKDGTLIKITP